MSNSAKIAQMEEKIQRVLSGKSEERLDLASETRNYIRKWANYWYNQVGDNPSISLCDKWDQELNDEPDIITVLLLNPLFLLILSHSMDL